jgi:hypothetical protein
MADSVLDGGIGITWNTETDSRWGFLGQGIVQFLVSTQISRDFKCEVEEVSLGVLSTGWFPLNHEQMLRL